MIGGGFIILFGASFLLFPCHGQITSPTDGTWLYFLNGSTANITWSFDDDISTVNYRAWYFTSSDGSIDGKTLGSIVSNGNVVPSQASGLSGVTIIKPASLILENVNQTYNGTYRFDLSAGVGGRSQVVVFIAMKPNVTINCSDPTTINEGDDFTGICQSEGGNPPANLTWCKDGDQIDSTSFGENILTLTNVTKQDGGRYTCKAQSYTLVDVKSCGIIVHYKPSNTTIKVPKQAYIGKEFTITCESDGVPAPNYTITHNGTIVSNESTYTKVAEDVDAGTYNCTAKNVRGMNSDSGYLTVIKGQITPTPSTSYAATSSIPSNGTETAPTTLPTSASTSAPTSATTSSPPGDLPTGAIIGIIIGVLVLIIIVGVVVYYCKPKEKERSNSCANIDPVPGNGHELEEPGPSDGAYDTVWTSGSKSKAPVENALPPVYAAVDKNNRQGNTLYASLDNKALQSSRASKKEPDRPQQTEYASIDFAKTGNAPKTV